MDYREIVTDRCTAPQWTLSDLSRREISSLFNLGLIDSCRTCSSDGALACHPYPDASYDAIKRVTGR